MKILITGGSGLLGHKVAEVASERGYTVFSGYNENKPIIGQPVNINLLEPSKVVMQIKEIKPDIIVHAAALTNVDYCEINKELAYKINVDGTKAIATISKRLNTFLVYISTDYVFDGNKGMYKEEDTPNPINYYGYTKLLGEREKPDIIARTSVIYGSKPANNKVNFVLWLIENLRLKKVVKIITDQFITPTLNTNLAKMIIELIEKKYRGIFHLAGGTRVSRYDFALKIAEIFQLDKSLIKPISMSEIKWKAKRPKDTSLDTSKVNRLLQNKPMDIITALNSLKKEISEMQ